MAEITRIEFCEYVASIGNETEHKATHERDKEKLRWLQQFLRKKLLNEIDRMLIDHIAHTKAKETSPSTANRHLALVRTILRKACHEWEWTDKVPKIRLSPEPKRRVRWLTPEQVKMLLKELPAHQQDMVIFALSTGLRQSNVINLEWNQVDLDRKAAWIHPDQAKARKAIHVPLNTIALATLFRQSGKHPSRVFTYNAGRAARGDSARKARAPALASQPRRAAGARPAAVLKA